MSDTDSSRIGQRPSARPGGPATPVAAPIPAHADVPKYRPDVDGLRAIAVLSVVAFHAAPGRLPGGFVGVDVFFVISGFLITAILFGGLQNDRFSFLDFYRRRIKRIFPALLMVLGATLTIGYWVLADDEMRELAKHVAGGAGFIANFVLWSESGYFDHAAETKPFLHLWSLGIEEQFYIVWPPLLYFAWRRRLSLLLVTLVIAAASFALNVVEVHGDPTAAFYSPLTRFWELLVGAGLTLAARSERHAIPVPSGVRREVIAVVGAILLGAAVALVDRDHSFPGWWALLPTIGTAFLIHAGPGAWLNRTILANRVLVWFGLISFPLYLWHWPLLSILRILEGAEVAQWKRALAVGTSILLAWTSYRWLETPIRHGTSPRTVPLLAGLMAGAIFIGCFGYFGHGFDGRPSHPRVVNAGETGHYAYFHAIEQRFHPCTPSRSGRLQAIGTESCGASSPERTSRPTSRLWVTAMRSTSFWLS